MKDEKILQEEILSDEQLEKISGGNNYETCNLIFHLLFDKEINKQLNEEFPKPDFGNTRGLLAEHLKKKYGIDAEIFFDKDKKNKYSFYGKEITHEQVFAIVKTFNQ